MHSLVVDIRRDGLNLGSVDGARVALCLLLVQNIMFCAGLYSSGLDAKNGLLDQSSGEIGIGRKSFPVAAAERLAP